MNFHIIKRIVDIHEKGIITQVNVCIPKHKHSNNCMSPNFYEGINALVIVHEP